MKNTLVIFLLIFSFQTLFAQEKYKIYAWEDVQNANPDTIFGLTFKKSKISSLPSEIESFTNLKFLDFSKNKFKEFPTQVIKLRQLETLIFNRNEITIIPEEIELLSALKFIDFWDNPIANFPDAFLKLSNLEEVHAEGIKYGPKFHEKWLNALPMVKIFWDSPCDCRE